MPNQQDKAGNIGDIVKHCLLSECTHSFGQAQSGKWVYCETHAGYFRYDLDRLKVANEWKGERAWSLGVVEKSGAMDSLGRYGAGLKSSFAAGAYPGSILLVKMACQEMESLDGICGWDIGQQQVDSYSTATDRIVVNKGDGYQGVRALRGQRKLVLCDPFWDDNDEARKVSQLIEDETHLIVWYPVSKATVSFRNWCHRQNLTYVEVVYRDYKGGQGWGRDMQGAGLVMKGLPESAISAGMAAACSLKAIFEDKRHPAKPRRRNGDLVTPPDRELSLRVTVSL